MDLEKIMINRILIYRHFVDGLTYRDPQGSLSYLTTLHRSRHWSSIVSTTLRHPHFIIMPSCTALLNSPLHNSSESHVLITARTHNPWDKVSCGHISILGHSHLSTHISIDAQPLSIGTERLQPASRFSAYKLGSWNQWVSR